MLEVEATSITLSASYRIAFLSGDSSKQIVGFVSERFFSG